MLKRLSVTAVYKDVENGWIQARIVEIPAVITAAPTAEQAKEFLLDALHEYLLSLQSESNGSELDEALVREDVEIVLSA